MPPVADPVVGVKHLPGKHNQLDHGHRGARIAKAAVGLLSRKAGLDKAKKVPGRLDTIPEFDVPADEQALIQETFRVRHGTLSSRVTDISGSGHGHGAAVQVKGAVFDGTTEVGRFEHLFPGDGTVHHLSMALDPKVQGQGFATVFNRQAEEFYATHGVRQVKFQANIDVGSFAWARSGYDFDRSGPDPGREGILNDVEAIAIGGFHSATFPGFFENSTVKAEAYDLVLRRDRVTPFEVSELGINEPHVTAWSYGGGLFASEASARALTDRVGLAGGEPRPIDMWPGKFVLLGRSWNATRDLSPLVAVAEAKSAEPDGMDLWAVGEAHDAWVMAHVADAEFHPDMGRLTPGDGPSDYNLWHVDVHLPPVVGETAPGSSRKTEWKIAGRPVDFTENLHPRDHEGRFRSKPGSRKAKWVKVFDGYNVGFLDGDGQPARNVAGRHMTYMVRKVWDEPGYKGRWWSVVSSTGPSLNDQHPAMAQEHPKMFVTLADVRNHIAEIGVSDLPEAVSVIRAPATPDGIRAAAGYDPDAWRRGPPFRLYRAMSRADVDRVRRDNRFSSSFEPIDAGYQEPGLVFADVDPGATPLRLAAADPQRVIVEVEVDGYGSRGPGRLTLPADTPALAIRRVFELDRPKSWSVLAE